VQNDAIIHEIKEIVSQVTGLMPEEFGVDDSMVQDIGLSSFEITSILRAIEKRFQTEIPTQRLRSIVTIRDFADYIGDDGSR
jgi:acyl carrier protein